MKTIKLGVSLVLAFGIISAMNPAYAGEVRNRIVRQEGRIDQGIKSGTLTIPQAAHLQKEDARINNQRLKDLKANDGKLTKSEYHQLNHELNHVSKQIYKEKHS
jgi:hypothetical protein